MLKRILIVVSVFLLQIGAVNAEDDVVKLSPKVKKFPLDTQLGQLSRKEILDQTDRLHVLNSVNEYFYLPEIIQIQGEKQIASKGDTFYVNDPGYMHKNSRFSVIRVKDCFKIHESDKCSQAVVEVVGEAKVVAGKNNALIIENSAKEVRKGDRVIKRLIEDIPKTLHLTLPTRKLNGKIIYLSSQLEHIGRCGTILIDLGLRDGLKAGNVFKIYRKQNPYSNGRMNMHLPDMLVGELVITKVFNRSASALVRNSDIPLKKYDTIGSLRK